MIAQLDAGVLCRVQFAREANQIFYSLHDPLLTEVLDTMRRYFLQHLEESLTMLQSL